MALRARPLHDRIVVKVEVKDNVTEGGIHVVEFRQKKERCGEVVAVGEGLINSKGERMPMALKVGDRVIFGSYAGTEIQIDGEEYQIMRESDVACVVDPGVDVSTDGIVGRRSQTASHYQ